MPLWLVFVLFSVVVMAGSEITQKITMTAPENISSETSDDSSNGKVKTGRHAWTRTMDFRLIRSAL